MRKKLSQGRFHLTSLGVIRVQLQDSLQELTGPLLYFIFRQEPSSMLLQLVVFWRQGAARRGAKEWTWATT